MEEEDLNNLYSECKEETDFNLEEFDDQYLFPPFEFDPSANSYNQNHENINKSEKLTKNIFDEAQIEIIDETYFPDSDCSFLLEDPTHDNLTFEPNASAQSNFRDSETQTDTDRFVHMYIKKKVDKKMQEVLRCDPPTLIVINQQFDDLKLKSKRDLALMDVIGGRGDKEQMARRKRYDLAIKRINV